MVAVKVHAELFAAALSKRAIMEAWEGGKDGDLKTSRLGIEPKTPGWLVQDPTTSPSGDLIPTIRGSGVPQGGAGTREEPGTLTQGAPVFPGSSRLGIELKTRR